MSSILVFLKLTLNIHTFMPLFNCKTQIVICHVFLDTLRISWYTKDFFNWKLPCMFKHSKGGKVFSKPMDKGLPCYYIYGYFKIVVNVSKKILIHYSHIVWPMHSIYDYFFTHDKLMATHKKLTPSLRFLPLFNCSKLSFAMCFFKK
jgi:hypothetical protein